MIKDYKTHRPVDRADPGFTIIGFKLRWISGKVAENNPGRPWMVLRKQDCPERLVKHLESYNPMAFANGETIRRGDLVLAATPSEIYDTYRAEIRQAAKDQEALVKRAPQIAGKSKISVQHESVDSTDQMIEQFKKKTGG